MSNMKKYKVTYGTGGYMSTIIEATSEDHACDLFDEEYPDENGVHDCFEHLEHQLFKKYLLIEMPDSMTYGVPLEMIARSRAEHYKSEFNNDVIARLVEDTIPLFESNDYEIHDWAANNMNWKDVKNHTIVLKRKTSDDEFQEQWVNGEYKIK